MLAATYDQASVHLDMVLGIKLADHLDIRHQNQLKHYAVLGPLMVAYRYAEALGQRLVIFDMTTTRGDHQSHVLGTEFDFDFSPNPFDPVQQINMTSDLLRVREILYPHMDAFRVGVYFDYFNNTAAKTYGDYKRMYGKKRNKSMHLGVRYRWQSQDYHGARPSKNHDYFSLWGVGTGHFGMESLWVKRIRSWDIGLIKSRAHAVACTLLGDFAALDSNPPTMMVLGAGMNAAPA